MGEPTHRAVLWCGRAGVDAPEGIAPRRGLLISTSTCGGVGPARGSEPDSCQIGAAIRAAAAVAIASGHQRWEPGAERTGGDLPSPPGVHDAHAENRDNEHQLEGGRLCWSEGSLWVVAQHVEVGWFHDGRGDGCACDIESARRGSSSSSSGLSQRKRMRLHSARVPPQKRKRHGKTKNAENKRETTAPPKTHEASRTRVVFRGRGDVESLWAWHRV
jgi:hypothetical protein